MNESETFEVTVGEYSIGDKAFFLSGKKHERERIIKLLEEDGERNYISQETFDYVVSIIKGENK